MTTVFVGGSMNIKHLAREIVDRLANIVESNFRVIVGDASGVDSSLQETLRDLDANNVTVFCSGNVPRNNIGGWTVSRVDTDATPGSRAFFSTKDLMMARLADYGLMIW